MRLYVKAYVCSYVYKRTGERIVASNTEDQETRRYDTAEALSTLGE